MTPPRPSPLAHPRVARLVAVSALTLLSLGAALILPEPTPALAQRAEVTQIVILNVPRGGTRTLAEAIAGPEYALYPQSWFEEQAVSRGYETDGLLSDPQKVAWVMQGAKVTLMIRLRYSSKLSIYRVEFISPEEGLPTHTFEIDAPEEGLDEEGAATIEAELTRHLKGAAAPPTSDVSAFDDPPPRGEDSGDGEGDDDENFDPNILRERAIKDKERAKSKGPKNAATVRLGFRLHETSLLAGVGQVNALNYTSGGSPGYHLSADIYPAMLSSEEPDSPQAKNFGITLSYLHAFRSFVLTPVDPLTGQPPVVDPTTGVAPTASTRIQFIELEGGVFYRISPGTTPKDPSISPKLVLRRAALSLPPTRELSTNTFFSIVAGADFSFPFSPEIPARLTGSVELAPFSSWGQGADSIGQTNPTTFERSEQVIFTNSYTYALGGALGLTYDFTPNLGAFTSFSFDTYRSTFEPALVPSEDGAFESDGPRSYFTSQGVTFGIAYTY